MKAQKFRKKPVVVTAYQTDVEKIIKTLEGKMKASPGDWIVTGTKHEKYPVKPDIFKETYEPVHKADGPAYGPAQTTTQHSSFLVPKLGLGMISKERMLMQLHPTWTKRGKDLAKRKSKKADR